MCYGENMPLDVLFVRDDDIPDLVQEDVCDLGLVGLNVVEEKRLAFRRARHRAACSRRCSCWISAAASCASRCPTASTIAAPRRSQGKRIATTYPHILGRFLAERGISAEVVVLSGSVEIAPRLGRADVICDLVSTGSTLAANHLREAEVVLESQAVLIRTPVPIPAEKQDWTRRLLMRIDGVEQVKGSKYIMLHAPRSGAAGDREAAAGKRGADGDSARRPGRPGGRARRVPRERVLGNARGAEERRRELRAGAARREDAGLRARIRHAHARLEHRCRPTSAARHCSARRSATPRASRASAARASSRPCAADGDAALRDLTERFDGVRLDVARRCRREEFEAAERALDAAQMRPSTSRSQRCATFTPPQAPAPLRVETAPGVLCERISVPVRAVGLYVPAGSAPLPSTAIMLAVPAAIAGCPERIMCTPPHARRHAPIRRCWSPRAGPASSRYSRWAARRPSPPWPMARRPSRSATRCSGPATPGSRPPNCCVASDAAGAAADLPAGVTEVMVIADESARADFVAADLLAQAEHGAEAQALLVTPSAPLADERRARGASDRCSRCRAREILASPCAQMRLIVVDSLDTALRSRERVCARAPAAAGARAAALARAGRGRRCGVPRPLVARNPWGTIAAGPITRCRRTAMRARTAGCRSRIFKSASPCRSSRPEGLRASAHVRVHPGAASKDWMRMPRR